MGINVDALMSFWWLWLTILFTIISLVYIAVKVKKHDAQFANVPAVLASIGWGYLTWTETGRFGLVAVFGFFCVYVFIQWEIFCRFDHKLLRLIYYLLINTGFVILVFLGLYLTGWEWYGFLLGPVMFAVFMGLMNLIFRAIKRKMILQETYFLTTDQTQRKSLFNQITQLRLAEFQKKVAEAKKLHQQGQAARAGSLVNQVIGDLDKVGSSSLSSAQKQVLGEACMLRAQVNYHLKRLAEVEKDAQRAKQYVKLDLDTLGMLADASASGEKFTNANAWCLEYLAARQETPPNACTLKVSAFLESQCELKPDAPAAVIDKAQATAREVIKADSKLQWPYRVLGQAAALRGEWQEARQLLEPAEKQQPENKAISYYLGLAYYRLNEFDLAYPRLRIVLQDNPEQPEAAFCLGMILLDAFQAKKQLTGAGASDLNQAVEWLEHAAAGGKRGVGCLYPLAQAYALQSQPKKAYTRLDAVLAIDAKHAPTHRLYGDLSYKDGKLERAAEHYGKVSLDSLDEAQQLQYGHCMVELNRGEEALKLLQPLTESATRAVFLTGRAHLHLAHYPEALTSLETAARKEPADTELAYYLGCALAWQGKMDNPALLRKAAEKFKSLLASENEFSARASLQLGLINLMLKDFSQAESHFQTARKTKALELGAGMGLARALLAQEKAGEARNILEGLETRHGGDVHLQLLLGLCLECQGQYEDAEQAYRRASATAPLGVVLYMQGKVEEAVRVIQQARSQGESSDRLLYYSGLALADRMQYPEAIQEWAILAKRRPEDTRLRLNTARAWYLYAGECFEKGNLSATVTAWENFLEIYTQDDETRNNTGLLHLRLALQAKELSEAKTRIQTARKMKIPAVLCDQVTALCQFSAGQPEEGIKTLEKLHARQHETSFTQFNLGLALLRSGQAREAIPFLENVWGSNQDGVKQAGGWALAAALGETGSWSQAAKIIQSSQPV